VLRNKIIIHLSYSYSTVQHSPIKSGLGRALMFSHCDKDMKNENLLLCDFYLSAAELVHENFDIVAAAATITCLFIWERHY
jgi:hypothetical protein